jgi:proteic killer suppression protein
MEVIYANYKIEKLVGNEKLLRRKYGEFDEIIKQRINELYAATSLGKMPPHSKVHPLTGNYKSFYGIELRANFRMIIEPVGDFDKNDIYSINKVEILELFTDYHKR